MKRILLLLFVLCLSPQANAQGWEWKYDPKAKGPIIWTGGELNRLNLHVRWLPGLRNLSDADVTIVSRKDTINMKSDEYGGASCDEILADSVWIKVSYKGYETVEGKIKSRTSYEVRLKKKEIEIPEPGSNGAEVKDAVKLPLAGSSE